MHDNHTINHQAIVSRIVEKEFGTPPVAVSRMSNGICNEVYLADTGTREVIVRMNEQPRYVLGSHNHIPIFRAKGIRMPEILAEDYSKSELPVAYQVLSKLEGRDINDVIHTLTDDELRGIAGEISNVFTKLRDVPNNGKFGVLWGDGDDLVDSWSAEVARVTEVVTRWGTKSGVIDDRLKYILRWINENYRSYFDSIRPVTYFGDLAAKNVMIHEGRFSGLVDLDALAQGDPLEAIGRIKAGWYGTRHGEVYARTLIAAQQLDAAQEKIVTMYALLNRSFWTLENGVQFNANTSARVDREREIADKAAVEALFAELQGSSATPQLEPEHFRGETVKVIPARPVKQAIGQKPMLEASGLSKTYASDGVYFDALKDVDLKIMGGDCLAIVGKSGSGKSTLMHLLACLDKPTEGYVFVDGDETSTMTETEKNILRNEKFGFVFQQFFLNGRDTVFENVVLPMRIRGVSDYEMITDAEEAIAAVGLADKTHKRAKDLSGGEKQRVCIARALVGKPQVIFADEPTGNLDSNTGAAVEQMLFDLNRQKGITLVIVTHDPDLADRCERIIEMKDGRIVAEHRREAATQ